MSTIPLHCVVVHKALFDGRLEEGHRRRGERGGHARETIGAKAWLTVVAHDVFVDAGKGLENLRSTRGEIKGYFNVLNKESV